MLAKVMLSYKERITCVLILWVVWRKESVVYKVNGSYTEFQETDVWLTSKVSTLKVSLHGVGREGGISVAQFKNSPAHFV